jgi:ribosome-binding protein aMBF1 (putative translation factor)
MRAVQVSAAKMAVLDKVYLDQRRLRAAQARAGILRGELAQRAKIAAPTLRAALRGDAVNLKSARGIAAVLGVSLSELLVERPAAVATR